MSVPDGTRNRRYSPNRAKREWYARFRAIRFARHFGFEPDLSRAVKRKRH